MKDVAKMIEQKVGPDPLPPQEIKFALVNPFNYVNKGQWFLRGDGTIFRWDFDDRTSNKHPVYELVKD